MLWDILYYVFLCRKLCYHTLRKSLICETAYLLSPIEPMCLTFPLVYLKQNSFLNSMLTFSLVGTEYCRNSFHLKLRGQSAHERSNKVCKVCLARNSALSRWLGRAIYASIVCTFLHRADISRAVVLSFFHVPRRPFSTLHAMFCAQHAVRYAASETTVVAHCSDGWIGGASYLYKLKDW